MNIRFTTDFSIKDGVNVEYDTGSGIYREKVFGVVDSIRFEVFDEYGAINVEYGVYLPCNSKVVYFPQSKLTLVDA